MQGLRLRFLPAHVPGGSTMPPRLLSVHRVLPDTPPTKEDVLGMSAGQLKAFLQSRGVSATGMFEKSEMVEKALSLL